MSTSLLIMALVGLLLPLVSARVSKAHWDSSVTGLITGGLAAADGVAGEAVTAATQHTAFDLRHALLAALLAWAAGTQLTQRGVLAGTDLEARLLNAGSSPTDDEYEDPTVGLDFDGADDLAAVGAVADDPGQPLAGVPPEHEPEHAAPDA